MLGVVEFLVKQRKAYAVNFTIRQDLVGLFNLGALLEGKLVGPPGLVGGAGDVECLRLHMRKSVFTMLVEPPQSFVNLAIC